MKAMPPLIVDSPTVTVLDDGRVHYQAAPEPPLSHQLNLTPWAMQFGGRYYRWPYQDAYFYEGSGSWESAGDYKRREVVAMIIGWIEGQML